jgi:UDP-GlcNAc:undecaprenyl-phosphate/decaprenyl-phosphate GlcNAc-1-phosphate transferase
MIFAIFSFLLCLIIPVALKKFFPNCRLSVNKEKPMFLGISVYLSFFSVFFYSVFYNRTDIYFYIPLITGSSLILAVGILDDTKNLSVKSKLAGQIIAASAVVFMGVRTSIVYLPVWANMVITVIWVVALINSFNFLDVMDGLCTGISFIICCAFLFISVISGMQEMAVFFYILCGSILAAFLHNAPRARFYLGDSGSMVIGFIFACSAVQIRYAPDMRHSLSLIIPLLIMGLPLSDLIFTILTRWKKGLAVFKKSSDHAALMLKNRGLSVRAVLAIMYGICILSATSALLLKVFPVLLK